MGPPGAKATRCWPICSAFRPTRWLRAEPLTPERRKAVTLDTLLAMMDPLAADQPALFIFEDLHWADPTTLELLDRVTRSGRRPRSG